jgi:hypothetical protein
MVGRRERQMIPHDSYGAQMQAISAYETFVENYCDPADVEVGTHVPYRDETDDTDDQTWMEAEATLRQRGLRLDDDGDGYVVRSIKDRR